MRRRAYLAGATATTLALAGCTALDEAAESVFGSDETYDIGMSRMTFEPDEYETTVGETVVWRNTSESTHTVTAYEGSVPAEAEYFASGGYETEADARDAWIDRAGGGFDTGETFSHTFEVAGTYAYFCIPHEIDGDGNVHMVGTIVVRE